MSGISDKVINDGTSRNFDFGPEYAHTGMKYRAIFLNVKNISFVERFIWLNECCVKESNGFDLI